MSYEHVLAFVLEHPWAVTPSMRGLVASILARRLYGGAPDPAELSALVQHRKNLPQPVRGGVAVIPFYGVVAPRMNMFSDMSGGTTFEGLTRHLHDALANDAVKTIVFDVDSPGGNVAGATEFAAEVLKARTRKPIVAQVQHMMASAAYWGLAGATRIVASPSAIVGALGVVAMHDDISDALAKEGVKREVIAAGKHKAEAVNVGPLADDERAHIQDLVDKTYGRMVGDIAAGRGVKASVIRGGYGEGRTVSATDALDLGMVDAIATLSETLARYAPASSTTAGRSALSDLSLDATDQEPPYAAATSQELRSDMHWQNAIFGELLSLDC